MTTLEEAKAFLKKEGPDGSNLYDHLSDVLLKILVERPENLQDSFEYMSSTVRQQRYEPPADVNNPSAAKRESSIKQEKWANAALSLLKIKSEEEAAAEKPTGVADLLDEANMYEWAGIGFSKSETFRLSVSIQRLAQANGTTSLRFWGKILGFGADFYIAEGELGTPTPDPEDLFAEEGSTGVNKYTYWTMKDDGAYEWTRLPNVTRAQILSARLLRRYVRADLDGKVVGNPPFPGTEKHFLRAQIARISAGTVIAPAGYFQTNDNGDLEPIEDAPIQTAYDLTDLGNWTHFSKEINSKYGRMTPMPPKPENEEEAWESEEMVPALRSLAEDQINSWRLDRYPATLIPAVGEFAVVRSLVWPGAVSIAVGKKFLNVYVGHGVKYSAVPYQRPLPQPLQAGYGVGYSEDSAEGAADGSGRSLLRFEGLVEQTDVLEDPSPPDAEAEE